jgi:hypothetical protein
MLYPTVTEIPPPWATRGRDRSTGAALVLCRPVPAETSWCDRLWFAWDEAQLEAELAYEAWRTGRDGELYAIYRAAQDRADAAQDALAHASPSA